MTPTIATISPSTVWTGGQLVTITGTHFNTWAIPSSSTGRLPPPTPTVQVSVGGVNCTSVEVRSASEITCKVPIHDPGLASLTVQNLDADGAPVSGEVVTATNAITYARPDLTTSPDLSRLADQVVIELRRQVMDNVLTFVSADYAESPFDVAAIGKLPAIVLTGPTIVESRNTYAGNSEIEAGGYPASEFTRTRVPLVVDMQYELMALTDNARQLVHLQTALALFFQRNSRLSIPRDPTNLSAGSVLYDMEAPVGTMFRNTTEANKSNVRSMTASFVILGVAIEQLAGFTNEGLVGKGGVVDNEVALSVKL